MSGSEESPSQHQDATEVAPSGAPQEALRAGAQDAGGEPAEGFRSGFVALVGRPNAGKSTLVNRLIGTHVSIATHKPQTTRNRIRAILTLEERAQIIFVDTPGIHLLQKKELNRLMVEAALRAMGDADCVLFLVDATCALDATGRIDPLECWILEQMSALETPVVLLVNKIDRLERPEALLPILDAYRGAHEFAALIPISALEGRQLDDVIESVVGQLPQGPMLYPPELYTDQAERFMAAEMVRRQITLLTEREVPYSVAVEIESFKEDAAADLLRLRALIHVERSSQKAILIGKGGSMIKKIGERSRHELERFFGRRVALETFVRVQEGWADEARSLGRFGYALDDDKKR